MSAPPPLQKFGGKDLYRLLRLTRTATLTEIKSSYRKVAMSLHPDRHGGCDVKSAEFKEASEAYRILSDHSKRAEYDRWLDGVELDANGQVKRRSRAAERNPFYRKVYSPAAPPGMKTFDRQRHYDMHYGDGMMNEEIERARKRAAAASGRKDGEFAYHSPLGAGFSFDKKKPMHEQMNPYSRRGKRQHDHLDTGGWRIEYEEAYLDMNGMNLNDARNNVRRKEVVVERMKDRRRMRVRKRGDDHPAQRWRRRREDEEEGAGCVVM